MPENIRKGRNIAIILAFIEFACCVLSFGYYDLRRSRLLLALIIITCLTTLGGLYAKVKCDYCGILAHAMYSISIVGGFYIYIMIDYFVGTDNKDNGLSGTIILLVSSIPMFGIFVMGIYSVILASMIDAELEARSKVDKNSGNNRAEGRQ